MFPIHQAIRSLEPWLQRRARATNLSNRRLPPAAATFSFSISSQHVSGYCFRRQIQTAETGRYSGRNRRACPRRSCASSRRGDGNGDGEGRRRSAANRGKQYTDPDSRQRYSWNAVESARGAVCDSVELLGFDRVFSHLLFLISQVPKSGPGHTELVQLHAVRGNLRARLFEPATRNSTGRNCEIRTTGIYSLVGK